MNTNAVASDQCGFVRQPWTPSPSYSALYVRNTKPVIGTTTD